MLYPFRKFLKEGNPLARVKANADKGRHFVTISSERGHLSPAENNARMKELKGKLTSQGYGYRKTKGVWEGGHENSLMVHAKGTGDKHGAQLVHDMQKHAQHYDQDSILHHNGKKLAKLIGTNKTGRPGMGKYDPIGDKINYNPAGKGDKTEFKNGASFNIGTKEK